MRSGQIERMWRIWRILVDWILTVEGVGGIALNVENLRSVGICICVSVPVCACDSITITITITISIGVPIYICIPTRICMRTSHRVLCICYRWW